MSMEQPQLPYPEKDGTRTSGWSGSDASHEARISERDTGTLAERLTRTLTFVEYSTTRGLTVKDLCKDTGWHHGQASAALSVLHQQGRLVRLQERRDRCHLYVLPRWQMGREDSPPRKNQKQEYPYASGEITVLGPECFLNNTGEVIFYKGDNYYRRPF